MKFLQKWTARFFETQCTAVVACGWFGPPLWDGCALYHRFAVPHDGCASCFACAGVIWWR